MNKTPRLLFTLLFCLALPIIVAARPLAAKSFTTKTGTTKTGATKTGAETDIRAVLEKQVEDWNAGRLEEFMAGYWRSPKLTFFSGGRKMAGWDATIERYRKTYQAEGKEMGKLQFLDLDIQPLGTGAAVVRGRYELTMSDGKKPNGLFTLIFRKFKDGWKIIHDHTSSNQ